MSVGIAGSGGSPEEERCPQRSTCDWFPDGVIDMRDITRLPPFSQEYRIPHGSQHEVIEEVAKRTQQKLQEAEKRGVENVDIFPHQEVISFKGKK